MVIITKRKCVIIIFRENIFFEAFLRRAVQPLTVKKNAACNKGRGAKDEAQLIETSAKRSYVPVVYYGSRHLLPNARCKKLYARTYLRLDACVPSRIGTLQ